MAITLTSEQIAIIDFVRSGKGHLIIEALAGCAKTTTLLAALEALPQRSALLCAFNKRIADELLARLPRLPKTHAVHVRTFHAQGLSVIKKHYPKLTIDASASEKLVNKAGGDRLEYKSRRAAVKLLRLLKETISVISPPSSDDIIRLGLEHDLFLKMSQRQIEIATWAARDAYILNSKIQDLESIDFPDMVWLPVVLGLAPPSRYQAIFIDELQDINEPQFALLAKLLAQNGRMIAAGDIHQQIYDFRSSMGARAWRVLADQGAQTLPLTISFRCPTTVIEQAQTLVPHIQAGPSALPGSVSTIGLNLLPAHIARGDSETIHTFVLSRTNAELLDCALFLWQERVGFQLNAGSVMLEPLFHLLDYVLNLATPELFKRSLKEWFDKEIAKADKAGSTAYAERIEDQFNMLSRALNYTTPTKIKGLLASILQPGKHGVLLSTVHKVKGLEADRVFLLKQTFIRYKPSKYVDDWADPFQAPALLRPTEELNIEYVAITRAKEHLIWVDINDRGDTTDVLDGQLNHLSSEQLSNMFIHCEREMERLAGTDPSLADQFARRAIEISDELNRK